MKRSISHILIVLIFTASSLGASIVPAIAAPATTQPNPAKNGQALEISPPVITLSGNPGQTIKTQIYLRDISSSNLIVTNQVNDFVAAGDDGTPKLILKDEHNNPYSLKDWISPVPQLQLVSKEIKSLTITINVPANAAPGGHYGVIRFTGTPASLQSTGVSLSASLGALILFTVNGKTTENLSIQEFSVNHNEKTETVSESGPLNFVERFKNSGNVHEQPVGQVTITDMFGKKVGAVNVNLPPRNILPQSTRKFSQPLDNTVLGNKKLFGRYHAKLSVTYGASKKVLTASLVFWVIPYRLIGTLIVLLIAGFFVLRFLIRNYNRRVVDRARRNNPPNNPPNNSQSH
jgi:hypothetical protein